MTPLDKLMRQVLKTVAFHEPAVSYGVILASHNKERTCKVSSVLSRLKLRGLVVYSNGYYSITDKGREELTNGQ